MDKEPRPKLLLGTAVTIDDLISVATVTSATVVVKDPSSVIKVTAPMVKQVDKVYRYIYQSSINDVPGDYLATITLVYNGYNVVRQDKFTLYNQE